MELPDVIPLTKEERRGRMSQKRLHEFAQAIQDVTADLEAFWARLSTMSPVEAVHVFETLLETKQRVETDWRRYCAAVDTARMLPKH